MASFQVERGFRIEVVAAEPLVTSPVAVAFDEKGRLFVAEMPAAVSEQGEVARHSGRIRVLEDPDEKGVFRTSELLAENLAWPSAVTCYGGGVFVASLPDVLNLKDTGGEGPSDVRRTVLTGFGGSNTPSAGALLNNFNWGLNGRIHGATAGLGGLIAASNWPGQPVLIERSDFSFNPRSLAVFPETGPAYSGLTFDSTGRKFVCGPFRPLRQAMYEAHYWLRNPFFPRARPLLDVANRATPVFHLLPRPGGAAAESKTNQMAMDWLNDAQGVVVYRGNVFPAGYAENVFICNPALHAVHRMVLRETGIGMTAARPANERNSEFLLSPDASFNPVQAVNGPDGALYIVDQQKEKDRGRIYRVVPDNFKAPRPPQFATSGAYDLVAGLAHPNGWHRDTATRLLFERQDPATVPLLGAMLTNATVPAARIGALRVLALAGALHEGHVLRSFTDTNASVREHGLIASETLMSQGAVPAALWERFKALAADPSMRVRYQLALSLGAARRPDRHLLLAQILSRDAADPWLQTAVLSSLDEGAGAMFRLLGNDARFLNDPAGFQFLLRLLGMIGTQGRADDVAQAIDVLGRAALQPLPAFKLVSALGEGLRRTRSSLALVDTQGALATVYASALAKAIDGGFPEMLRVEAVRMIGFSPFNYNETSDWLLLLCNPQPLTELRAAAIETLGRYDEPRVFPALLERWAGFSPLLRRKAALTLLERSSRVPAVLAALEQGSITPADIPPMGLNLLRTYRDPQISQRATRLLGPVPRQRPEVLDHYRPALRLRGNAEKGRQIFAARCSACHQVGGTAELLGPDLAGARTLGREKLLSEIIEPGLNISPEYAACVIETEESENVVGIKTEENPLSLTLRHPGGATSVWPRLNVRSAHTHSWSLMPEGLEQGLSTQDMADLLDYLMRPGK